MGVSSQPSGTVNRRPNYLAAVVVPAPDAQARADVNLEVVCSTTNSRARVGKVN